MCTNHVEIDKFPDKNKLSPLFFIFSSDVGQKADFIFFLSSDREKKTLSDVVDQTIYCGCPNTLNTTLGYIDMKMTDIKLFEGDT